MWETQETLRTVGLGRGGGGRGGGLADSKVAGKGQWVGWLGLRAGLQCPPARLCGGGFLFVVIFLHLHSLVFPYYFEIQLWDLI